MRLLKTVWFVFFSTVGGLCFLSLSAMQGKAAVGELTEQETLQAVRGGSQTPCAIQFASSSCSDKLNICGAIGSETDCTGPCISCSSTNDESRCYTFKPYNALTCTTLDTITGGCGTQYTGRTCQWIAPACKCSGGALTENACDQRMASSSGVGGCAPVNP
jgi:hypothetical protein